MKKWHKYLVFAAVAGFSGSTGAAFINGYSPCDIYGICESNAPDLVKENERLMKEAELLRDQISQINQENLGIVEGLQQNLQSQQVLNQALSSGISTIADISAKGVSNEQKIMEIGQTLQFIGRQLAGGPDE